MFWPRFNSVQPTDNPTCTVPGAKAAKNSKMAFFFGSIDADCLLLGTGLWFAREGETSSSVVA